MSVRTARTEEVLRSIRQTVRRSERLHLPPARRAQTPPQANATVRHQGSSEFDAGLADGSLDGRTCRRRPRQAGLRGGVRVRRAGTKAPHVRLAREVAATLAPRCKHRERFRNQHPFPHFRFVGVFRSVVRHLENGRLPGRSLPTRQNTPPARPGKIRAKQHREVSASTQSATAASLGDNVGTRCLDCPAPGIRGATDCKKSWKASSSGDSDQISHAFRTNMRRLAMACAGFDAVFFSRENTRWIS